MSNLSSIYKMLKEKGLITRPSEEREQELEQEEKRTDFILWKESLGKQERMDFEEALGKESYSFNEE